MKTSLVWERLRLDGARYISEEGLGKLCAEAGREFCACRNYLLEHGYLHRIFRGLYYVSDRDELDKGLPGGSALKIVGRALAFKGVRHWYFGYETALKLNGLTHEYFTVDYLVTDALRTTKPVGILGRRFAIMRRDRRRFRDGIVRSGGIRFSDPERTVLDLAHRAFITGRPAEDAAGLLEEYGARADKKKLRSYIASYPPGFRAFMERYL
jgi:predicted transcriptional regulator of viral defense system